MVTIIGTLFNNRYRMDSELGRGGMGTVFKAHDTLLKRDVAIKLLGEASGATLYSNARTRLLHEAQAAARLNHPNIVKIYDADRTQQQLETLKCT
jgi:serine/threonine protein kinase